MKQFFIYLAVSFLIQSASAQTPTSSPEVRNGDYAIRKQASHDEISGGAWISYTLSFSLPANSGPVTITDNFTLPAATTINPLLWSSINIAGGLNVLQAFTVNVNGRSGTCILENISNAAISSIITFNVAAPNGDVFDGNLLANQVTMTGQGGAINLTTAAVNTLIRVGNPFGTSITRVWQNASSTLGSCFVLPNGHYVVLYEINLFVNQGSACYFANGLSLSFPVASPFAGAGTPTVTDAQELANNNWNPISVPALQSGNLVFNLVGNPAGYYGRRQSFRITVDYGVLTPTAVANIPASVQLNGTQNNTPFSAAANTTHCVISPTPGNGPVDPLPCNDPNNTLGQTALYPTAMLGCTDNSWTTQITNNKCSGIQTLFFDEIIPSGLMVNGIQYRTPNVVAFNPVGGAAGVTETVTVYNASGNSAVIAPNYIQGTFFNCAIPANVPIAGGQVVRITVALSGENIAITQTATLIMGVSIPFGVPLGNIQNTTSVLTDAGMGNREWTGTASSTFEVIPPGPRMCTWKYNCDPNKLYNPASVATASSPAVAGGHVRFLLAVMNTGSAPLNNATFTDVLPAGFTYVPNSATYFTIPSGDMHNYCASQLASNPASPIIANTSNTQTGQQQVAFTLPTITGNCTDEAPLGASCGQYGFTTRHVISFEAEVGPAVMAGQHQNNFTISGINPTNNSISGPITSNFATILVNGRVSATLNKSIIVNGTAQSSTTLAVGQTALFRLTYNNTSNTSVNDVRFIDLLPMNQANTDGFILSRNVNRGSNVNLKLSNVLGCAIIHLDNTRTTATPQIFTDASTNIHLQEIGIIPSTNTGINVPVWQQPLSVSNFPTARNVKWEFSNITVGAGEAIECEFEAQTPASISGTTAAACNTFVASATGNYTINGVTHTLDMIPIESPPACLTITPPCNCAANTPLSTAVTSGSSSSVWTCGKTYSVTCDKGYDYTANYKCNGNCTPTFTYQITNNATGAVVTSGATASFHFAILASGTYTLTWIANCGGTQCVTCSYLIKVSCANSCVCDVKQNILVSYSPTDPIATSNTISCGKSIKGKCGQKMKFGATYTCTPTSCASRIEYTITRTSAGFTPVIGTTSSFSYTFSGNGTYDITWVAYCNNVICQKCVTTVIIEDCATPCVCCKESEILIKSEAGEVNIANHSTVGNYLNYANVLSITTTRPFVELSADVIDFQIRAKESGCKPICMKPFLSATPSASSILGISPLYSDGTAMTNPANQQDANPRELIWKFSTPVTLTNETVKFTFALPIGADISCCEATAYLCIKLRFKDEKCNVCEQTYCVEVPITQLVGNKKPIPALKKK